MLVIERNVIVQKKKINLLLLCSLFFVLIGCQKQQQPKEHKSKSPEDALIYTFDFDKQDYQFRLLDGWIKFPEKDSKVAFFVANKEKKAFMSAGFEEKKALTLTQYTETFVNKVTDAGGKIKIKPEAKKLNGKSAEYLGFQLQDQKKRWLTYRSYLIEMDQYYINLAAWTSDENPDQALIDELNTMLSQFKEVDNE